MTAQRGSAARAVVVVVAVAATLGALWVWQRTPAPAGAPRAASSAQAAPGTSAAAAAATTAAVAEAAAVPAAAYRPSGDGAPASGVAAAAAASSPGDAVPAAAGSAATYAELVDHLKRKPDDARVWVLKARADMEADRHAEAAQAFGRALALPRTKVPRDPHVWVEYAEALALAQGGKLEGEPRKQIAKALELNPLHPQALDLAGTAAWEQRDYRAAAAYWRTLLAELPPGHDRVPALREALESAEQRGRFSLPAPRPAAN